MMKSKFYLWIALSFCPFANLFSQVISDTATQKISVETIKLSKPRTCIIPEERNTMQSCVMYIFDDFLYGNSGNAIISRSSVQSGSNYLPVEILGRIAAGADLDESIRLRSLNVGNHKLLRLGAIAEQQVQGLFHRKSKHFYLGSGYKLTVSASEITANTQSIINVQTSPNLASLYLLGNGLFSGKSLDIGHSSFDYIQSQSVGFDQSFYITHYGIDPEVPSIKGLTSFSVGFRFNRLATYRTFDLQEGSIYTAPYGQYLDLAYQLKTTTLVEKHPVGLGFNARIMRNFKHVNASVSINNFGYWKLSNLHVLSADTSFRYQGIVLQTWGQNPQLPNDSLRSMLGLHSSITNERILLPGNLKIQLRFQGFWRMDFTYWYTLKALPLLEIQYLKWSSSYLKLGNQHLRYSINPILGYGGFGTYHIGFMSGLQYKKLAIMLNVNDLQSILIKNQSSFSAGLKLGYAF